MDTVVRIFPNNHVFNHREGVDEESLFQNNTLRQRDARIIEGLNGDDRFRRVRLTIETICLEIVVGVVVFVSIKCYRVNRHPITRDPDAGRIWVDSVTLTPPLHG